MIVRFDNDRDILRAGVGAKLTQACGHSGPGFVVGCWTLVRIGLAAKHPHIRRPKRRGQIDEAPSIGQLCCPLGGIFHIHLRGATDARNA